MGSLQPISMAKLERRSAGAMRVAVLDPDPEIRNILHQTIGEWPEFLLVGESRTGKECKALLDVDLSELLIMRTGTATPNISPTIGDALFSVWIGLRPRGFSGAGDCAFDTLDIPLDQSSLRTMLGRVHTEIFRRKLDELSGLLRQYVSFSRGAQSY